MEINNIMLIKYLFSITILLSFLYCNNDEIECSSPPLIKFQFLLYDALNNQLIDFANISVNSLNEENEIININITQVNENYYISGELTKKDLFFAFLADGYYTSKFMIRAIGGCDIKGNSFIYKIYLFPVEG